MSVISSKNLEEFCLICLGKCKMESSNKPLTKETLSIEALKTVTSITTTSIRQDQLQQICPFCVIRIKALYSFRERALSSTSICQTLIASEEDKLAELKLFCRLCLLIPQSNSLKYRYGDFEEYKDLCNLVFECTSLKLKSIKAKEEDEIVNDPRYPDIICKNCHIKLCHFKQIRYQAKQSEEIFQKVFKKHRYKTNNKFLEESKKVTNECNDDSVSQLVIDDQMKIEPTDFEEYNNMNESNVSSLKSEHFKRKFENEITCNQLQIKTERDEEFFDISLSAEGNIHELEFKVERDIKTESNTQPMDLQNTYIKEEKTDVSDTSENPLRLFESNNQNKLLKDEINEGLDDLMETRQSLNNKNCSENLINKVEINDYEIIDDNNRPQIEDLKNTQIEECSSEILDSKVCVCTQCNTWFSSESKLQNHIDCIHFQKQNKLFRCKYCINTFSNYYNIQAHINNIHFKTTPKCEFCQKWFSSESSLKKHKEKEHSGEEDKLFQCLHCESSFSCKKQLKQHRSQIHLLKRKRKFKCHICTKACYTEHDLNSHLTKACYTKK